MNPSRVKISESVYKITLEPKGEKLGFGFHAHHQVAVSDRGSKRIPLPVDLKPNILRYYSFRPTATFEIEWAAETPRKEWNSKYLKTSVLTQWCRPFELVAVRMVMSEFAASKKLRTTFSVRWISYLSLGLANLVIGVTTEKDPNRDMKLLNKRLKEALILGFEENIIQRPSLQSHSKPDLRGSFQVRTKFEGDEKNNHTPSIVEAKVKPLEKVSGTIQAEAKNEDDKMSTDTPYLINNKKKTSKKETNQSEPAKLNLPSQVLKKSRKVSSDEEQEEADYLHFEKNYQDISQDIEPEDQESPEVAQNDTDSVDFELPNEELKKSRKALNSKNTDELVAYYNADEVNQEIKGGNKHSGPEMESEGKLEFLEFMEDKEEEDEEKLHEGEEELYEDEEDELEEDEELVDEQKMSDCGKVEEEEEIDEVKQEVDEVEEVGEGVDEEFDEEFDEEADEEVEEEECAEGSNESYEDDSPTKQFLTSAYRKRPLAPTLSAEGNRGARKL